MQGNIILQYLSYVPRFIWYLSFHCSGDLEHKLIVTAQCRLWSTVSQVTTPNSWDWSLISTKSQISLAETPENS